MFHNTPKMRRKTKRPKRKMPDINDDSSPESKIHIVKLVAVHDNEEQFQIESHSDNLPSSSDQVNEDMQSDEIIIPDDISSIQSKQFSMLESASDSDDSMHSPEQEIVSPGGSAQDVIIDNDNLQPIVKAKNHGTKKVTTNEYVSKMFLTDSNVVKHVKKKASGWITNRHKLKFQEKWFTEFPFIDYDKKNNLMFCKACRNYVYDWRKSSPFVIGTDNFRVSMIKYHQKSSMHTKCQELANTITPENHGPMKDLFKEQLSHAFRSVYFILKNKMPYTHYPELCKNQKQEGTDFIVYGTNLKVVPLFGKFIRMAYEKELAQKIANIPEFSLVIDASLQRGIENHDLVYLKYLDNLTVQTVFLDVIDSSAKLHDSMYNTLTALFKKYNIERWVDKVVYIMTDRSDSHIWLEGLVNLIKCMSPQKFFSEVKYLSHKVKTCANVVQNHKITSTFDALLWSIYLCYDRVDQGKKNLIHMSKKLDEINEYYGGLPKNSFTTICFETLEAVEKDYASLVILLEAEQLLVHFDAKVRKSGARILSGIKRSSFICKLALFLDIFSCLNEFAIKLSSEDTLPYDMYMLLDETCASIDKAASGEGDVAMVIAEELANDFPFFRGIKIVEDRNEKILSEVKKFCLELTSYLKSLVDESLLEKSYIFNVSLWPDGEELATFGNSEFRDIFLKFNGSEKNLDTALAEWDLFKAKVVKVFPPEVRQNSKSVIMKMMIEYDFPFVTSMLRKILLLNFESGEIKRGYHEMCLNKSVLRSMLSLQSLQTSMMIAMYGPSLNDFDFSPAMELFLNSRHRQFRKKIITKKLES